jgi:hypothetical protein
MRVWQDPPHGVQAWHDEDGAVWVTRIGRGWIAVPPAVWEKFTAKVKRGDYDRTGGTP